MNRRKKKTISKTELRSQRRRSSDAPIEIAESLTEEIAPHREIKKRPITLPAAIVVRDFADLLQISVGKVIQTLLSNGIMATVNQSIDFDTAAIIADELGFEAEREAENEVLVTDVSTEPTELKTRSPVITIMGHVDHGKTSLLDRIRESNVVASESGGITQHIGAYQVEIPIEGGKATRTITFLDTPGHEAFAALRAHGANITDIVILVVAANEGVQPQTIEALSHARAANVPIIVALTKIDLPDVNIDRVKKELADHDLLAEEWGGQTQIVLVSAKTGEGVEQLLEMVLLVADLKELAAPVDQPAIGVVIESHLRPGLGPLATLLVQQGTLKVGDAMVAGSTWGKIRVMQDWRGKRVESALPAMPVQAAGLKDTPHFGDRFRIVPDEKTARTYAETKSISRRQITFGGILNTDKEGTTKELPVILKADVVGSIDAITQSLKNLSTDEVAIRLILTGVGPVSDSDVNLASGAKAIVLAFRVPIPPSTRRLADQLAVQIYSFEIIYQLIDEMAVALSALMAPELVEIELGRLTVLKIFRQKEREAIIGGRVTSGQIGKNSFYRIERGSTTLGEGKIVSVQRGKESVSKIAAGFEGGLGIEGMSQVSEGDVLISFRTETRSRQIETTKNS